LKAHAGLFAVLALLGPGALLADNFTWGGTYIANWDGFGTSPYTAIDTSLNPHQTIQIFCLDFNDSIAPPLNWSASVIPVSQANVAGTGGFAGQYAAQYGGDYNSLLTSAFNDPSNPRPASEHTAPQISGPPFAFTGDTSAAAGAYAVNITTQDPYTRYLMAAWLFTDILHALPGDVHSDMIAQVAAWELFVNASNTGELTHDVDTYGGSYVFNNYLALATGQTYLTTSTVHTQSTPGSSGISFQQAVDAALAAAQTAVITDHWGPGSNQYISWGLVTATPDYVIGYGQPVQEFLSPTTVFDQPHNQQNPLSPVPEPGAVFLLATAAGIVLWTQRARLVA